MQKSSTAGLWLKWTHAITNMINMEQKQKSQKNMARRKLNLLRDYLAISFMMRSTRSSSNGRHTTCTPTGRPVDPTIACRKNSCSKYIKFIFIAASVVNLLDGFSDWVWHCVVFHILFVLWRHSSDWKWSSRKVQQVVQQSVRNSHWKIAQNVRNI